MKSCQKVPKFDFQNQILVKNHPKLSEFHFSFVIDIFENLLKRLTTLLRCYINDQTNLFDIYKYQRTLFLEMITRYLLSDNSFFYQVRLFLERQTIYMNISSFSTPVQVHSAQWGAFLTFEVIVG